MRRLSRTLVPIIVLVVIAATSHLSTRAAEPQSGNSFQMPDSACIDLVVDLGKSGVVFGPNCPVSDFPDATQSMRRR